MAQSIPRNYYFLISVSFLSSLRLTWVIIRSFIARQCHSSTNLARGLAGRPHRVVIMLRSSLTLGSLFLAGSMGTTCLTTCTSSISPLLRISPR